MTNFSGMHATNFLYTDYLQLWRKSFFVTLIGKLHVENREIVIVVMAEKVPQIILRTAAA